MNVNAVMGMKFPVLPVMGMTVFAGMMNVLTLTKNVVVSTHHCEGEDGKLRGKNMDSLKQ